MEFRLAFLMKYANYIVYTIGCTNAVASHHHTISPNKKSVIVIPHFANQIVECQFISDDHQQLSLLQSCPNIAYKCYNIEDKSYDMV